MKTALWTCVVGLNLALGLVAQEATKEAPKGKQTSLGLYVTSRQAYDMWKADPKGVKVIDVRTPEEYIYVGHAPMAHNVPGWFVEHAWDASKKRPKMRPNAKLVETVRARAGTQDRILLMCRSGGRSARATDLLAKAGFKKVYNVIDGFEGSSVKDPKSPHFGKRSVDGWKNSNLPWTYKLDPKLMHLPATGRKHRPDGGP